MKLKLVKPELTSVQSIYNNYFYEYKQVLSTHNSKV